MISSFQKHIFFIIKTFLLGIVLVGITNRCYCKQQILPEKPMLKLVVDNNRPAEDNRLTGGVQNLGGTCYMNSVLQVLQAFYEPAISNLDSEADPLTKPLKNALHATKVEKRTATSAEAKEVFQALGKQFSWTTNQAKHCDAAELLLSILRWIGKPNISIENYFIQHRDGNQQLQVSSKFQDEFIYPIDLPSNGEACVMQSLLDNSLAPKQLDEKYRKDDGTLINNVYKHMQLKINKNESLLTLQLKRFDVKGGIVTLSDGTTKKEPFEVIKLYNKITSPMSLKIPQQQTNYNLVGFIWHSGNISSGHYKAYIKEKRGWICYNDSAVAQITEAEAEIRAQEAYVFFYQP